MILVIGGAFQGKKDYCAEAFHLSDNDFVEGGSATMEDLLQARAVSHFQDFIRREVKEGKDVMAHAKELADRNPGVVIIANEIGYGVVPADAFDREYRETVGSVCTYLASRADEVHRVICGVGTVIKKAPKKGTK
ncbi:MAG: bifunctional adenosylcobinamide kinase/adenosylcobinamide-phosphate guanylyltransferase [Eubacterium sp.]|nr:bifunctional adenosylcobinamide kinase/adenosylcobinamide-phosphate guanylyltransferase [Eubacterium sp.]